LESDAHLKGSPSKTRNASCDTRVTTDAATFHRVDMSFREHIPQA
jgi:hypothetical protein